MKTKLYSIYDAKTEIFSLPMFMLNAGAALRAWTDAANDPQDKISKHPGDYTLFEIGEWEDTTGIIKMHDAKQTLGTALEYQKNTQQNIQDIRSGMQT